MDKWILIQWCSSMNWEMCEWPSRTPPNTTFVDAILRQTYQKQWESTSDRKLLAMCRASNTGETIMDQSQESTLWRIICALSFCTLSWLHSSSSCAEITAFLKISNCSLAVWSETLGNATCWIGLFGERRMIALL